MRQLCFKAVWPTSPRDFVVATSWTELRNGSILIVSRSVPHILDEQPGYVRGCVQISGFLIQPDHDSSAATTPHAAIAQRSNSPPGGHASHIHAPPSHTTTTAMPRSHGPIGCKVTLCAHTELGGTLPASIINMLSTSAPIKMLSQINDIVVAGRK